MDQLRSRRGRRALAVAATLVLSVGMTAPQAVAQSAGDRQYVDPLATPEPPAPEEQGGGNGAAGDDAAGTGGGGESAAPQPAPVESLDETIPADPGEPVAETGTTATSTLPRTGVDGGLLAALGAGLLAAGALLRRAGRPARARA